MRVWKTEGWCVFFFPWLTCLVSAPHHDRWLIQHLTPFQQLKPFPPSTTFIAAQSQQSWWKDLPQASRPNVTASRIIHSNDSQIGSFSFSTLENNLSQKAKREAMKPDEAVWKEWPPDLHISFLHESYFVALSHTVLLLTDSRIQLSVL